MWGGVGVVEPQPEPELELGWKPRPTPVLSGSWELGAGSWELGARSWELGAGSRSRSRSARRSHSQETETESVTLSGLRSQPSKLCHTGRSRGTRVATLLERSRCFPVRKVAPGEGPCECPSRLTCCLPDLTCTSGCTPPPSDRRGVHCPDAGWHTAARECAVPYYRC